jgi:hypothetical protein
MWDGFPTLQVLQCLLSVSQEGFVCAVEPGFAMLDFMAGIVFPTCKLFPRACCFGARWKSSDTSR